MKAPVSIIIPTFNEGKYIPALLDSIKQQTLTPAEVIIVDAFSTDNTVKLARSYGYKVILDPSWISGARNIGANTATQPYLLFLDSDVVLQPTFIEKTMEEMVKRKLDVASCHPTPLSSLPVDKFLHQATSYYLTLTKNFKPHAPGFCIFSKKEIHDKIGGFDQSLVLAEDHDYVQRARKYGKFAYMKSCKIPVSVRRLSEEGRMRVALKYIAVEIHLFLLGKIRKNFFTYKFGQHYM